MSHHIEKCWDRLSQVIRWSNMTTNHFAHHIGLLNGENLYQIKRGNHGISHRLASTIVEAFPQINLSWLLTGEGEMFATDAAIGGSSIDYYGVDVEANATRRGGLTPTMQLQLPEGINAEFAMEYRGDAMGGVTPTNTVVMLRRADRDSIILGREYLVCTEGFSLLRILRAPTMLERGAIRLTAEQSRRYDDMTIPRESIVELFEVVAKLIIN